MLVGTRHASSYGLPTWTSNRGYQGVVETDARTLFEVCSVRDDALRIEVWSDHFTLWVFQGSPANALTRATGRVLGRPMRPPSMAFAPWNDALFGSASVRALAKKLRDNDIPSSVIWTEDWRGGTPSGDAYRLVENWDLDSTLYPDAQALAAELKTQGFSWQAYFNAFLVQGNPIFDEAKTGGHFVSDSTGAPYLFSGPTFSPTGLADLSRPATREWVKSHLRRALDLGFTGWMADFGEWLPHDAVLASGEDPLLAHNRYAHEWATLSREVLDERQDGTARLFFSRSGWFKSNEVTPVVWAGDQRTSFQADDGLPTVVPLGLNLGLAGVSTFGHDIGGYQSATNPVGTKELFFRWASLGALSPVMRTHHGTNPHQGWHFDSDDETLAHYRRWAKLHTQLFPYLDASAIEAHANGMPLMRALPLLFPDDEQAWRTNDEYLLGGALLVAPVLTEGATSRSVYFPTGEWVPWSGGAHVVGPSEASVPAPMGELPLYARAGALVPMVPSTVDTFLPAAGDIVNLNSVRGERLLRLFVGGQSFFTEADGTSYTVQPTQNTKWFEGSTELKDCAAPEDRKCVDKSGPLPVLRLERSSSFDVPGAFVIISGVTPRTYDIEVVLP
jgi:alpha-glucosidase